MSEVSKDSAARRSAFLVLFEEMARLNGSPSPRRAAQHVFDMFAYTEINERSAHSIVKTLRASGNGN